MPKLLLIFLGIVSSALILFGAPVSAQTGQSLINNGLCTGANLTLTPSGGCETTATASTQINDIVRQVINILSIIVGLVAVIMIIVGGFRYITSGGSDTSVTSAKNTILYAVIGLIIVALAQVLVRFTLNKITNNY